LELIKALLDMIVSKIVRIVRGRITRIDEAYLSRTSPLVSTSAVVGCEAQYDVPSMGP
jgi:hypothetical protein